MDISYFPACFALWACDCDLTVGLGRASLSGNCAAKWCRSDAGGMNNLNGDPLCCGRAARATPEEKKSNPDIFLSVVAVISLFSLLTNDAESPLMNLFPLNPLFLVLLLLDDTPPQSHVGCSAQPGWNDKRCQQRLQEPVRWCGCAMCQL